MTAAYCCSTTRRLSLSEGEAAIVESKIFREKSEALDGFVLREMDGETLDLRVD